MTTKATKKVTFGGLTLGLRLDGNAIIQIERRLNESIVGLFLSSDGGTKLPPANKLLIVLQGANQEHGVSDDDIVEAFGKFIDQGHTTMELMETINDLLEDGGYLGKKDKEKSGKEESGKKLIPLDAPEETSPLD
ncbi:DUF6096 family protein [Lapidilactobacillus gannanensis]|uniref:DUF6096 family protein n=1 Tax=Lapidilactobacillus gannanensis TaxID=2486002 RepID=A0ABW4BPL6_9LACO|nr:DUF6096 family protein [Lapidilactobacillus gannanensis]